MHKKAYALSFLVFALYYVYIIDLYIYRSRYAVYNIYLCKQYH